MAALLPRFGQFSYANYVAYGFNVPWNLILVRLVGASGSCSRSS